MSGKIGTMKRHADQLENQDAAKLAVLGLAVSALGKLALQDKPDAYLTAQERQDAYQCLMDALEVLNDEKDNY